MFQHARVRLLAGSIGLAAILAAGAALATAPAAASPFTITVVLTPGQLSPPPETAATGFAQLILETDTNEVRFSFTLLGLVPDQVTGVHLHRGGFGVEGPLIATLSAGGAAQGVGRFVLSAADAAALLQGGLYLDVHSVKYPNGVIRGQTLPPGFQPPTPTPTPTLTPTPEPTATPASPTQASSSNPGSTLGSPPRSAITPPNTGDAGLDR